MKLDSPVFEAALKILLNLSSQKSISKGFLLFWSFDKEYVALLSFEIPGAGLKREMAKTLISILEVKDHDSVVELVLKIMTNLSAPAFEDRKVLVECGALEQLFGKCFENHCAFGV